MPIPTSSLEPHTPGAPLLGAHEPPDAASGPIVVATAGAHDSDGAVRIAWKLAGRMNADVRVVSAVESSPPAARADGGRLSRADLAQRRERTRLAMRVQAQLEHAGCAGAGWPVTIEDGRVDDVVARVAHALDACAILVGHARRGAVERALSGEHVMRLLRRADMPVYAVDPTATRLARRVVVAMDFSRYAMHAAATSLRFVAPDAVVTLAHVWPRGGAITGWERTYELALPAMFEAVRHALDQAVGRAGVQVETVTLVGHSAGSAVNAFVEASGADLVVAATHGYGVLTRLAMGSVAADLLHHARCSFFCVPGTAAASHRMASAVAEPMAVRRRLFQGGPPT